MRSALNTYAQLLYEQLELTYFLKFYEENYRNSEQIVSVKNIPTDKFISDYIN